MTIKRNYDYDEEVKSIYDEIADRMEGATIAPDHQITVMMIEGGETMIRVGHRIFTIEVHEMM